MPGILVVEDDENLNRGITFSLKKSGYEVFSAESVKKAKRIASDNNVDVTICDVNLPDGNGLEFVRWMRCNYNTYIICLTALDQVMGYEAGADDYLTKPFSATELMARIRVALRHYYRMNQKEEIEKPDDAVYTNGEICLDNGKHMVYKSGQKIHLTPMEYNLLYLFMRNPGKVLTYHTIL